MANQGDNALAARLRNSAFAFRGYNITNLGRTPALLAHPAYGPIMGRFLREGSDICADVIKQPVDLVGRVREGRETRDLRDYPEDVALIVAVEMAQLKLLEEFFGIAMNQAKVALGNSLGESTALIAAGVYEMKDLLRVPLALARDCAELARDVSLCVLFSRGPVLDLDTVRRLCLQLGQRGEGIIDVSTYLSPNSLILMGQNGTLGSFEALMHDVFPQQVYLRRNQHRWPPLHTSIMWQRNIPNRSALLMQTTPGGLRAPAIRSCRWSPARPATRKSIAGKSCTAGWIIRNGCGMWSTSCFRAASKR